MTFYSIASIATTVLAFVAFLCIVAWAFGRGRKQAFDEAANAPFALPDEIEETSSGNGKPAGPSQGAHCAPLGGSVAATAASVGAQQ
jgi:cbb3-type cytochrome oxidase subunit 3